MKWGVEAVFKERFLIEVEHFSGTKSAHIGDFNDAMDVLEQIDCYKEVKIQEIEEEEQ